MNPPPVTPPSYVLKNAPALQVKKKATHRSRDPKTPSPVLKKGGGPRPAQHKIPVVQTDHVAQAVKQAPVTQAAKPPQPAAVDRMQWAAESSAAQAHQASPVVQPAAPAAPTAPAAGPQGLAGYEAHHSWQPQQAPPIPDYAALPPAYFIHTVPQRMPPNAYGPIYTTPNGLVHYYVCSGPDGVTKVVMTAYAASMQSLYRELGCTVPRYQEPEAPHPQAHPHA